MKIGKRIISFILAGSIVLTSAGLTMAKTSTKSVKEVNSPKFGVISYAEKDEGYTPLTTAAFIQSMKNLLDNFYKITGYKPIEEDKINFVAQGVMADIYQSMYENSEGVLDPFLILDSLPLYSTAAKDFYKITGFSKEYVIEALTKVKKEAKEEGKDAKANFFDFLIDYFSIIKEFVIYSRPMTDTLYEIRYMYVFEDDSTETHGTGIIFDAETKKLYGADDSGILQLGFDLETDTNVLYTPVHVWQRGFGFTLIYDIFTYFSRLFTDQFSTYLTKRIKFTYEDKEWMIQIWKGKYFITTGGEIGIYNRPAGSYGTYYNAVSDDEMMDMFIQINHGEDLIAKRGPEKHWWMNVFKIGPKVYKPETLTLYGSVDFPNEEMAQAFTDAAIYKSGITAERDGTLVSFVF